MSIMGRLKEFLRPTTQYQPSAAYRDAMQVSNELIGDLRDGYKKNDVIRQLFSDIHEQRDNVPFVTTVYESVQEMKVAAQGRKNPGGES